jgi:hypothetical protein
MLDEMRDAWIHEGMTEMRKMTLAITAYLLTIWAASALAVADDRVDASDVAEWKTSQLMHLVAYDQCAVCNIVGELEIATTITEQQAVRYAAQQGFSSADIILEDARDVGGSGITDADPKPSDSPDVREPGLKGADPKPDGSPDSVDSGRAGSDPQSN